MKKIIKIPIEVFVDEDTKQIIRDRQEFDSYSQKEIDIWYKGFNHARRHIKRMAWYIKLLNKF